MLEEMLKNVREKSPLIHNITNYVRFVQDLILILEHLIRERLNQWSLLGKKLMNFIIQLY